MTTASELSTKEAFERLVGMFGHVLLKVDKPADQAAAMIRAGVGVLVTEGVPPARIIAFLRELAAKVESEIHEPSGATQ